MDQLLNYTNKKKAGKVRKLVKNNNLDKANLLSLEISEYLYSQYPDSFNIKFHTLTEKEENDIRNLQGEKEIVNYLKTLTEYLKNSYPTDILIFSYIEEDDIEENREKPLFTYFMSQTEPFDEEDLYLTMPNSFYKFLETLGLTIVAANKLYNLKNISKYENFDYLFPREFAEYDSLWPNI